MFKKWSRWTIFRVKRGPPLEKKIHGVEVLGTGTGTWHFNEHLIRTTTETETTAIEVLPCSWHLQSAKLCSSFSGRFRAKFRKQNRMDLFAIFRVPDTSELAPFLRLCFVSLHWAEVWSRSLKCRLEGLFYLITRCQTFKQYSATQYFPFVRSLTAINARLSQL